MDPVERVLDALRGLGLNPRRSGEGWACKCPAHEDREPSLSISEGSEGRALIKCHAGCPRERVLERLQLHDKDLFVEKQEQREQHKRIVATYAYRDEHDRVVYEVVRYEPKTFRQRVPDGKGDYTWKMDGVRRVPYRLPEVLDAISLGDTIYVVEGERDVHTLEVAGKTATCNAGGAGKWDVRFGKLLANAKHVIIVADNDPPGLAHARDVAASLNGTPHSIVRARTGKDVTDHLAAGHAINELVLVGDDVVDPPDYDAAADEPPRDEQAAAEDTALAAGRVSLRLARSFNADRVHWLEGYEGFIPRKMVTLLAGLPGLGKSMLLVHIAAQESRKGRRVVLACAEDSLEHILIPRLVAAHADLDLIAFAVFEDAFGDGALHLPEHGPALREAISNFEPHVLGIDPIGSFMGHGIDAWKDTDVREALGPFKTIAEEFNLAAILVAHLNKKEGADYLTRISNSAAFGQFVRSGLLFARDPDDPEGDSGSHRVLASGKSNVGAHPTSRCYRLEGRYIPAPDGLPPDISTAGLVYAGESRYTADELLAQREPPSPETKDCIELLNEMLKDGPVQVREIEKAVRDLGLSMTPMRKACDRLQIVRQRAGFQGGATWALP